MSIELISEVNNQRCQCLLLNLRMRTGDQLPLLLILNRHTMNLLATTGRASTSIMLGFSSSARMRLSRNCVRVLQRSLCLNLALGRYRLLIIITPEMHRTQLQIVI
ncbi:nonstructural protein NSs [Bruconha virus]|uniref:Non-structural protein NS-S n=1 Tax=Bruconha virus TaxID=348014 RepID=A0A0H3VFU2_9VIRU|nr:nonstructural protein NSs [Bruconha virus]AKB96255.1 nonstructural protein NSs [Bruconha virus]QLA46979.1 NSs [Bruconha virus]